MTDYGAGVRADRLLALLLVLQSRGRTTAGALAEELEVSVRTVYRDLEALSGAGFPVYAERGPGGGCQLLEGYRLELTGLKAIEADALVQLSPTGLAVDLGVGEALAMGQRKLAAAAPPGGRDGPGRLARRVHLDPVAWFRAAEPAVLLPTVWQALCDERRLLITYRHGDGRSFNGTVDPLGVVAKAGIWYLVGAHRTRPQVFRVARLGRAVVSDQASSPTEGFEQVRFWAAWTKDFEVSLRRVEVRVRTSPTDVARLRQQFGTVEPVVPLSPCGPREPDLVVRLFFESLEAAEAQLLGLGPRVEVLSPARLRHGLAATATELATMYGTADESSR